jgi:hypothetical protein
MEVPCNMQHLKLYKTKKCSVWTTDLIIEIVVKVELPRWQIHSYGITNLCTCPHFNAEWPFPPREQITRRPSQVDREVRYTHSRKQVEKSRMLLLGILSAPPLRPRTSGPAKLTRRSICIVVEPYLQSSQAAHLIKALEHELPLSCMHTLGSHGSIWIYELAEWTIRPIRTDISEVDFEALKTRKALGRRRDLEGVQIERIGEGECCG